MKRKYAIALGEEWFTGFHFTGSIGAKGPVVGKSVDCIKLLDADELKLALQDLRKCDYLGEVFDVEITRRTSEVFR